MTVNKQNVTVTWKFMRTWTIHASIVVIKTSASDWLISFEIAIARSYKFLELHIFSQNYKVIALLLTNQNQVIFLFVNYVRNLGVWEREAWENNSDFNVIPAHNLRGTGTEQ